jgi:hypothetical protein
MVHANVLGDRMHCVAAFATCTCQSGHPVDLARVDERVGVGVGGRGELPLPGRVTPHTLRRTFATLCLQAGRDPRWVMAQIGHEDARLTLEVYAQATTIRGPDQQLAWRLMRFPDEPKAPPAAGGFRPGKRPMP